MSMTAPNTTLEEVAEASLDEAILLLTTGQAGMARNVLTRLRYEIGALARAVNAPPSATKAPLTQAQRLAKYISRDPTARAAVAEALCTCPEHIDGIASGR